MDSRFEGLFGRAEPERTYAYVPPNIQKSIAADRLVESESCISASYGRSGESTTVQGEEVEVCALLSSLVHTMLMGGCDMEMIRLAVTLGYERYKKAAPL